MDDKCASSNTAAAAATHRTSKTSVFNMKFALLPEKWWSKELTDPGFRWKSKRKGA